MSKNKKTSTMSDILKQTIERSGLTVYKISKETGVSESSLLRFMREETSLRLDMADRLATFFGLRLTLDPKAVPPEPTPENLARPSLAKRKKS
jgi:plasmid maintenance system antidote protein VapI